MQREQIQITRYIKCQQAEIESNGQQHISANLNFMTARPVILIG